VELTFILVAIAGKGSVVKGGRSRILREDFTSSMSRFVELTFILVAIAGKGSVVKGGRSRLHTGTGIIKTARTKIKKIPQKAAYNNLIFFITTSFFTSPFSQVSVDQNTRR
jgi:hypothetical protein